MLQRSMDPIITAAVLETYESRDGGWRLLFSLSLCQKRRKCSLLSYKNVLPAVHYYSEADILPEQWA